MQVERKKVVIIGGGITGLASAYYMQQQMREQNLPIDIILVEATNHLGGKIQTVKRDGFVIERGPDSFLIRKKSVDEFAEDLGIEDELVRNATGQAYIVVNGQLHSIPGGSIMGIPTELSPFFKTSLFTLAGKLRASWDLLLPRSNVQEDQALGTFFRRRLGNEVVENLIEPLLSGVYAGDIDHMSLQSTFPQFYEVEKKHRSLILGMKKTRTKKLPQKSSQSTKSEGAFHTFKNGLSTLVETVEEQLDDVKVYKGIRLDKIEKIGETNRSKLFFSGGEQVVADAVILTTGHKVARELFKPYQLMETLDEMHTTSVATVALAFPEEAVVQDQDGTGFLVARSGDFSITACTWTHRKWPSSTPKGKVLLRAFVGRVGEDAIVDLSDEKIEEIVLGDLKRIIKLTGKPDFSVITRFKKDRPQYRVGHKKRIAAAKEDLKTMFPTVVLAGASYEGVGLPDCIDQGKAAITEVLTELFPE